MSDGYKILAKYPRNDLRDRSNSQSSYASYNGDDQIDLTPKSGLVSRSQSRRSSVSHQHTGSQSNTRGPRYLNGSQLPATNGYRNNHHEVQPPSQMNSLHYKPGQYAPHVLSGGSLRSMVSEVAQHEIGMRQFQQQLPIAPMNNKLNTGNRLPLDEFHNIRNAPPQQYNNFPRTVITTLRVPNNSKENSPMKRT